MSKRPGFLETIQLLHELESLPSEDQQVIELDDAYLIMATVVDSVTLEW
ncbi:hypothetical protein [Nitrosomonas sp. sh817]|nr:hypothetical protein [Nitrosomonas sp. sh817]WMJ07858.1 hypothetical protein RBH92_10540 [Nitrosomonas sp. sh817]